MFAIRPNPDYVPGGVHNFWTLQSSAGGAVHSQPAATAAGPAGEKSGGGLAGWLPVISGVKGDTWRDVPDLLGLGDCTTSRQPTSMPGQDGGDRRAGTAAGGGGGCRLQTAISGLLQRQLKVAASTQEH